MSILPNLPSGAGAASFSKGGFDAKPEEGTHYNNGRVRRAASRKKFDPKPEDFDDAPIPAKVDRFVRERDDNRCKGCGLAIGEKRADGSTVKEMHLDHIIPRRAGGRSVEENLRCACERCNLGKGARAPAKWEKKQTRRKAGSELPPPVDPPPLTPEQQSENYDWRNRMDQSPKLHAVLARGQKDKHHEQAKTAKGKVPAHEQGRAAQGRGVLDAQRPADDVEAGSDADGGECAEGASG